MRRSTWDRSMRSKRCKIDIKKLREIPGIRCLQSRTFDLSVVVTDRNNVLSTMSIYIDAFIRFFSRRSRFTRMPT